MGLDITQVDQKWLQNQITLEEAIAKWTDPVLPVLFRRKNKKTLIPELIEMSSKASESDELWWFKSPNGVKTLHSGVALIRSNQVIDVVSETLIFD